MRLYLKEFGLGVGIFFVFILLIAHFRSRRDEDDVPGSRRRQARAPRTGGATNARTSGRSETSSMTGRRAADGADMKYTADVTGEKNDVQKTQTKVKSFQKVPVKIKFNGARSGSDNSYVYPQWYSDSVVMSPTYGHEEDFVGSGPLFPVCPNAEKAKKEFQEKTFGYLEEVGEFIPGLKNPCWKDAKNKLRCLPYFYVAGIPKCGTTDLYHRIREHPDIARGQLKEYHWWDRLRYGASMELRFNEEDIRNGEPVEFEVYSNLLMLDEERARLESELRKTGKSDFIIGDGSPAYVWENSKWQMFQGNEGCSEPRIVTGSFIAHAYPEAKIFLIFRHPTERLYSRFLSRIKRVPDFQGATPKMFHNFVVNAVKVYKDCFRKSSVRSCAYNLTVYDEAVVRIVEGMYSVFIEDWLRIFRRDQIMFIRSEDFSEDVESHMRRIFAFLGVAPLDSAVMERMASRASVNIGKMYQEVGLMLPETIAVLNEFYDPFIHRFAELVQDDRFLWKDIVVT
ncbi:hypothetical protein C0Q70_14691 [Pomacea canaliculata]|uniref:Sulfotransferase domain-containing protein n=2 Tax=Pomacea canaliculata TaxID=400727 RepID=A0A2T7NSR6_POMCA|nr:hypothetical protein C0Q70_14691 [Pomacea canaliculata]